MQATKIGVKLLVDRLASFATIILIDWSIRMNRNLRTGMLAGLMLAAMAGDLPAGDGKGGDRGLIGNQASPWARLHSVNLESVRWTDGFWAKRFATAANVSLPALWNLAADSEAGHAWQNMRIAAGLEKGKRRGTDWQDAWLYKWVESASYLLVATQSAELSARIDEVIDVIAQAQEPDGYIATQTQLRSDRDRYESERHHELYTMGHLITAACMHYRITGKTSFLDIARKAADHIHRKFKNRDSSLANFPINPSIIMAGVELYRTTGTKDYLDMAIGFVDGRGSAYGKGHRSIWRKQASGASDLNQNWRPLRQETEVVGHAVFFTYLYAGATDVYLETGDQTLLTALNRLWLDLTERKMFITGGVSPVHIAHPVRSFAPGTLSIIKSDSIHEGVGAPYDLPNDTAYNETCGQIGNVMWNWRMLAATGEARFADVMEQTIYNSVLSGVNLSGRGWSYTNPLRWNGASHVLLFSDAHDRFDPGERRICCPTNLLRTVLSWNGTLYATDATGLWIHHYGANRFNGSLEDGSRIALTEQTRYPWDGRITIKLDAVDAKRPFAIHLRIPSWTRNASLTINGEPADVPTAGSYTDVKRAWKAGDVIELDLPMPVRMIAADPRVRENRNQVAVQRGPIVYCLESTDLPAGVRFEDVHLRRESSWRVRYEPSLLEGVAVLETEGVAIETYDGSKGLYSDLPNSTARSVAVRLIPYYAWNNRGEPKMTVWLPLYGD